MGLIQVLDDVVADQIAAGEVVERPASVVKELLENAVDAGATQVTVAIKGGGVERIRIVDNGRGMSRSDLELCVVRHATSKLRTAQDLNAIGTLGFRGEALPSIASISRFSIRTKQVDDIGALRLSMVGGRQQQLRDASGPVGTEVLVEDLFFNVPARRKFLKTEATEAGHIQESVQRLGLCYPQLGIRFQKDGRLVAEYPPGAHLTDRVRQIFGPQYSDGLIPVHVPGAFGLVGVLGRPASARSTPRHYHVFINGRYVRDRVIMSAVQQAYGGHLDRGKHPFVVLQVSMPPQAVDVNVHPAKREVRFMDSRAVHRMVAKAIDLALRAAGRSNEGPNSEVPRNHQTGSPRPSEAERVASVSASSGLDEHRNRIIAAMSRAAAGRTGPLRERKSTNRTADVGLSKSMMSPPRSIGRAQPMGRPEVDQVSASDTQPELFGQAGRAIAPEPTGGAPAADSHRQPPARVSDFPLETGAAWDSFSLIGWMDGLCVLKGEDGFLFIHGDAAWRRIVYHRVRTEKASDTLTNPVTVELDVEQLGVLESHRTTLTELGFHWEPFGAGTQVLRRVPLGLKPRSAGPVFLSMLAQCAHGANVDECAWALTRSFIGDGEPCTPKGLVNGLKTALMAPPENTPFATVFLTADAWSRLG
ncbi:MAG: DNA mismatch repair endonuclease MutL [Myxococcota bacterium]|nr:DNA mismatch repair endonuclease MutL [Myxococcota bacterium]